MKKKHKIILTISVILLIIFSINLFYIIYKSILEPAYVSYQYDCQVISSEELNQTGYTLSGSYNPENNTIQIYDESNSYQINKHERIHQIQDYQNRIGSCSFPLSIFLNEIESYFGEKYPNWLFNFIY